MTEYRFDVDRISVEHLPLIDTALEDGAVAGDVIVIAAPLSSGYMHHTYYTLRERGNGELVARFSRDVVDKPKPKSSS